ncbi:MAG TPA: pyridoxamine 5'-phosphate oxidase [Steroidobacter sp.]
MQQDESLPEPLPDDPLPLFSAWFAEAVAKRVQPNPDAMVLATVGEGGAPSARVVLCKRVVPEDGYIVFFTNYQSRKGRELLAHPKAAAVFHWDTLHRQVRIEGSVVQSPESESDQYFASRALESRLSAWASQQSQPLASRADFAARLEAERAKFGIQKGAAQGEVPRPPHWGGFRLWIESIELWMEGPYRTHDRAVWKRTLKRVESGFESASRWESTRLQP